MVYISILKRMRESSTYTSAAATEARVMTTAAKLNCILAVVDVFGLIGYWYMKVYGGD
jgi:hypothetical protein